MIRNQYEADNALADALWWLKGYAAAASGEAQDDAQAMAEKLSDARRWLNDLTDGSKRMLGINERQLAIALTENEYEVIVDGLHDKENSGERLQALEITKPITAQLREERLSLIASQSGEVPF